MDFGYFDELDGFVFGSLLYLFCIKMGFGIWGLKMDGFGSFGMWK